MDRSAAMIGHVLYRDYLETAYHKFNNEISLLELEKDLEFCEEFVQRVLNKDFITRVHSKHI